MSGIRKFISLASAGLLLSMVAGAPAIADDTELLLAAPENSDATKPRILFIIDTSGSMDSKEETVVPYDPSEDYDGDCDKDAIYWMSVNNVLPDCAGSTEQYVDKDNWNCDVSNAQMTGLGSYAGVMAQYRDGGKDGTGSGPKKWQYLAAGYNSEPVECEIDAGIHGDGDELLTVSYAVGRIGQLASHALLQICSCLAPVACVSSHRIGVNLSFCDSDISLNVVCASSISSSSSSTSSSSSISLVPLVQCISSSS